MVGVGGDGTDGNCGCELTTSPGKDYSPRLIATKAPEIYLMAWVSNRNGPVDGDDLDIFYQLVSTAQ